MPTPKERREERERQRRLEGIRGRGEAGFLEDTGGPDTSFLEDIGEPDLGFVPGPTGDPDAGGAPPPPGDIGDPEVRAKIIRWDADPGLV